MLCGESRPLVRAFSRQVDEMTISLVYCHECSEDEEMNYDSMVLRMIHLIGYVLKEDAFEKRAWMKGPNQYYKEEFPKDLNQEVKALPQSVAAIDLIKEESCDCKDE